MSQPAIVSTLQIVIALGLINVWIIRSGHATKYRGAGAQNMKEEFLVYGLPVWFLYVVGTAKILIATSMILALFMPHVMAPVSIPALILLAVLMVGAISMHIKVKDPLIKIVPAIAMLIMSLVVVYILYVL